jgi:hypothetical protein
MMLTLTMMMIVMVIMIVIMIMVLEWVAAEGLMYWEVSVNDGTQ